MKKPFVRVLCVLLVYLLSIAAVCSILYAAFVLLMRRETVEQALLSPNGSYEAQVISSNHGATGGATVVKVKKVGILAKAQEIYTGPWGEFETLEIYWKDDLCLVINGAEHLIAE